MSFKTKKAFTLIEMLIVVVIIGILAAALIPRLQSVQGRARDTKRKADLSQLGSALAIYKSDVGTYAGLPQSTGSAGLVTALVTNGSYLTAMPTDSDSSSWSIGNSITVSNYGYTALARNGTNYAAFGLMARTETDGTSSNWVLSTATAPTTASGWALLSGGDAGGYETLICTRTTATSAITTTNLASVSGVCNALKTASDLRYVYFQ